MKLKETWYKNCTVIVQKVEIPVVLSYPRKAGMRGRMLWMKVSMVMVVLSGQVQETGIPPRPLLPQGGPVTACDWTVVSSSGAEHRQYPMATARQVVLLSHPVSKILDVECLPARTGALV